MRGLEDDEAMTGEADAVDDEAKAGADRTDTNSIEGDGRDAGAEGGRGCGCGCCCC